MRGYLCLLSLVIRAVPNVLEVNPYGFWRSKLLVWNHLRTLQCLEALPPRVQLALAEVIVP